MTPAQEAHQRIGQYLQQCFHFALEGQCFEEAVRIKELRKDHETVEAALFPSQVKVTQSPTLTLNTR